MKFGSASCHQKDDDNIEKKSKKKKKRETCDLVSNDVDAGDILPTIKKDKKKKKLLVEEDNCFELGQGAEIEEALRDDSLIKKKKKKRNSATDCSVEGDLDYVKVNEDLVQNILPHKKKNKVKLACDSSGDGESANIAIVEDPVEYSFIRKRKERKSVPDGDVEEVDKVEQDSIDNPLPKKKKKKRKPVHDSGEDGHFDTMVTEKVEPVDGTLLKRKRTVFSDEGDVVNEIEEPCSEFPSLMKKKAKLVNDKSVVGNIDTSVRKEHSHQRKHSDRHTDSVSALTYISRGNNLQIAEMNPKNEMRSNQHAWRRHDFTNHAWTPRQSSQSKYQLIPPQNVDGWQPMHFKFDNHPKVRHYIPRKLMAMNGIKQELVEMDEVHLKIPNIVFQGSSLYDIPGYGYGLPN